MKFIFLNTIVMTSFGTFAAVYWNKRFEETLTVSVFGIIMIEYIMGLIGLLNVANYLLYALTVVLLVTSLLFMVKHKKYKQFIVNMITPGSIAFAMIMAIFTYCIIGARVAYWDEFSHWATCVKIMFINDKLYSANGLGTMFGSYPPAMSLLQYSFMKINNNWVEWILYYRYAFLSVSIFISFFRKTKNKDVFKIISYIGAILLASKVFSEHAYTNLQVDLLIGIIFAYLMSSIICFDVSNNLIDNLSFSMGVAVLVLIKDSGVLFAISALIAYYIGVFVSSRRKGNIINRWLILNPAIFCVMVS